MDMKRPERGYININKADLPFLILDVALESSLPSEARLSYSMILHRSLISNIHSVKLMIDLDGV